MTDVSFSSGMTRMIIKAFGVSFNIRESRPLAAARTLKKKNKNKKNSWFNQQKQWLLIILFFFTRESLVASGTFSMIFPSLQYHQ